MLEIQDEENQGTGKTEFAHQLLSKEEKYAQASVRRYKGH